MLQLLSLLAYKYMESLIKTRDKIPGHRGDATQDTFSLTYEIMLKQECLYSPPFSPEEGHNRP